MSQTNKLKLFNTIKTNTVEIVFHKRIEESWKNSLIPIERTLGQP